MTEQPIWLSLDLTQDEVNLVEKAVAEYEHVLLDQAEAAADNRDAQTENLKERQAATAGELVKRLRDMVTELETAGVVEQFARLKRMHAEGEG